MANELNRATPSSPVGDELPPLVARNKASDFEPWAEVWTEHQVRQAQRDAVEADRARHGAGAAQNCRCNEKVQVVQGASVDTPEFRKLMYCWDGVMPPDGRESWAVLIAHIDAYVARRYHDGQQSQMARIQHLTHERDIARRAASTAGAWISIEEMRPTTESRVLVVGGDVGDPNTARVDASGAIWCEYWEDRRINSDPPDKPTHWMPIPQPPAEEA